MVKQAEADEADDEKRMHVVEARNHADATLHSSDKALTDFGDKVSPPDKAAIETALADLKAVQDDEDFEAIRAKTQTLINASMKLGEAMYVAQQTPPDCAAGKAPDDNLVDAKCEETEP
jgi:molecular chaperone DnaK